MRSPQETGETVTCYLVNAIHAHLIDQDFDVEEGEVKLIDRDDSTLFFGLFVIDEATGLLQPEPSIIWSIEVFADLQGGR